MRMMIAAPIEIPSQLRVCIATSETEDPIPTEMVGTPPRLKLSVLKNEMKLKAHVKARGRPIHTGTIWPSKCKAKNGKRKTVHTNTGKENLPPNKKVCQKAN